MRQDKYGVKGDSRQQNFRSQSKSLASRPKIASSYPIRHKGRCFHCRQFGDFAKTCPEKDISAVRAHHREEAIAKIKHFPSVWRGSGKRSSSSNVPS